ncbi:MAG: fasciclin domain-containing protein, partial [Chloroflexota bacterium]
MRKFLTIATAALLLALGVVPALAQNRNIPATAASDANFSTLVSLLETAELVEALSADGPFTVFAPTNDAFTNFLNNTGLTVEDLTAEENRELLTTILTFHVLPPQPITDGNANGVGGSELRNAYAGQVDGVLELTMLNGEEMTLQVTTEDRIIMNNQPISVNAENITASNGVIHAINGVLLPPSLRNEDGTPIFGARATVVDLLSEDPDSFSSLLEALEAEGFVETLSDLDREFTVFAPTNVALLGAQADLADADLAEILSLHVIEGEFTSQDILTEIATRRVSILVLDTIGGDQITIQIDTDGTILLNGQGITVADPDNQAANGVVHFIPAVMFPRSGLTLAGQLERDSSFSILQTAIETAGLTETLADPDADFTLLAPTDDAFANLLAATGLTADDLLADTELLTSILTFHVIEGSQTAQELTAAYAGVGERVLE